jgi:hypothetical protein
VVTISGGLASKPTATVFGDLSSKPAATVFSDLALKPVLTVFFSLASKLVAAVSPGLASKPTVGFFVEPKNQGGGGFSVLGLKTGSFGLVIWTSKSPRRFLGLGLNQVGFELSVAPQNRRREVSVGHALRSSDLLHVEASLARVSQSSLKTGGDAMTGGVCGTITDVTSKTS